MSQPVPDNGIHELERKLDKLSWAFVGLAGTILLGMAAVDLQVAFIIPKFERIFSEMLGGKPLPLMTQIVIDAGRSGAGLLLPVVSTLVPLGVVTYLVARRGHPVAWLIAVAAVFFQILWAGSAVVSLYLPMMSIITGMNGG